MIFRFKDYRKIPGIYKFENKVNNKCYIIKSTDICKSAKKIFGIINNSNVNINNIFYNDIKEFGIDNFDVDIIETLDKKLENIDIILENKLQEYIIKYDSINNGYNIIDKEETINNEIIDNNESPCIYEKVYMYNIKENYYQTWCDIKYASKNSGILEDIINDNAINKLPIIINNEWLVSYIKEELESKKNEILKNN